MRPPASGGITCTDSYRFLPHNIPGAWRREGRHATVPRSIVSPLHAVLPLQGGDLGAITGGAQIGTFHIPPDLVVRGITAHRKPPDVRICRLRNQSRVGTVPPSTSTPHWPACWARR